MGSIVGNIIDYTQINLNCPATDPTTQMNCLTALLANLNQLLTNATDVVNNGIQLNCVGLNPSAEQTAYLQYVTDLDAACKGIGAVGFPDFGSDAALTAQLQTIAFQQAQDKTIISDPFTQVMKDLNSSAHNNINFANTNIPLVQAQIATLQNSPAYSNIQQQANIAVQNTTAMDTKDYYIIGAIVLLLIVGGVLLYKRLTKAKA